LEYASSRELCLAVSEPKPSRNEEAVRSCSFCPDVEGFSARDTPIRHSCTSFLAEASTRSVGWLRHINAENLVSALAAKMAKRRHLRGLVRLDIQRPWNDSVRMSLLVDKFPRRVTTKHWPMQGWSNSRRVFDPESSRVVEPLEAAFHAKCIVAMPKPRSLTSANFTEAAQQRTLKPECLFATKPLRLGLPSTSMVTELGIVDTGCNSRAVKQNHRLSRGQTERTEHFCGGARLQPNFGWDWSSRLCSLAGGDWTAPEAHPVRQSRGACHQDGRVAILIRSCSLRFSTQGSRRLSRLSPVLAVRTFAGAGGE